LNRAVIDCEKLRNNVSQINQTIPDNCKIIAVVKGDAYGHGLEGIAKELDKNDSIIMFAVSSFEEAMNCINCGVKKKILLLNPAPYFYLRNALKEYDSRMRRRIAEQLHFSVCSTEEFNSFEKISYEYDIRINIHLRLDFSGGYRGFNRKGFSDCMKDLFNDHSNCKIKGIYSQVYSFYYDNPDFAKTDMKEYMSALEKIPDRYRKEMLVHFLTSLSYYKYPEYCFDAVRIGAALYGMPVSRNAEDNLGLQEVMSISGTVLNVVNVNGESMLDYTGRCMAQNRKIAVLSFGSWDIPNFFKSEKTTVMIRNHLFTIVGSPCMDSFCVDVTDCVEVQPGDDVWMLDSFTGISLKDKILENNFDILDCQMMFSGMSRINKYYK